MEKRDNTIQIMRSLAIIMVVMQHAIGRVASSNADLKIMFFLNHIDVAVFFIISGYLFESKIEKYRKQNFLEYVKTKFRALMVPYLFWSFVLFVGVKIVSAINADVLTKVGLTAWTMKQAVINIVTFKEHYVQHLWFIYILFIYFVIHWFFKKSLSDVKIILLIMIVMVLIDGYNYSFIVEKFLLHFVNFCIGRLVVRYNLLAHCKHKGMFFFALTVLLACFGMEYYIENSITYTYLGNILYSSSGVMVVYYISKFINYKNEKISELFSFIGNHSFAIYLIHNPYITMILPLLLKNFISNKVLVVLITTLTGVVCPIIFENIINRNSRIRNILFGR